MLFSVKFLISFAPPIFISLLATIFSHKLLFFKCYQKPQMSQPVGHDQQ